MSWFPGSICAAVLRTHLESHCCAPSPRAGTTGSSPCSTVSGGVFSHPESITLRLHPHFSLAFKLICGSLWDGSKFLYIWVPSVGKSLGINIYCWRIALRMKKMFLWFQDLINVPQNTFSAFLHLLFLLSLSFLLLLSSPLPPENLRAMCSDVMRSVWLYMKVFFFFFCCFKFCWKENPLLFLEYRVFFFTSSVWPMLK